MLASSSSSRSDVTSSSTGATLLTVVIAASIESGGETQMRTGIPTASRRSSENITFVGSATATSKVPSSRNSIGSVR